MTTNQANTIPDDLASLNASLTEAVEKRQKYYKLFSDEPDPESRRRFAIVVRFCDLEIRRLKKAIARLQASAE